jgi:hypothetical protein
LRNGPGETALETDHLKVELSTEGWRLSEWEDEEVERCLAEVSALESAPGDTAPDVSGPPDSESLFGVFGPPIFESRFLS